MVSVETGREKWTNLDLLQSLPSASVNGFSSSDSLSVYLSP